MSVSIDALLTAQQDKAKSLTSRLDSAVAPVGQPQQKFDAYFNDRVDAPKQSSEEFKESYKEKSSYEPKELDDYRQQAVGEYDAARDDVGYEDKAPKPLAKQDDALNNRENSTLEVREVPADDAPRDELSQTASEVVAVIEAEKEAHVAVQPKVAEERGVASILNQAVHGGEDGEVHVATPANIGETLARGEQIIQSRQQAGAVILGQQPNAVIGAQQFEALAQQAVSQEAVVTRNANSAVNVARQSKAIAQELAALHAQSSATSTSAVVSDKAAAVNGGAGKALEVSQLSQNLVENKQLVQQMQQMQNTQQASAQNVSASGNQTQSVSQYVAASQANAEHQMMNQQQQKQQQAIAMTQKMGDALLGEQSIDADSLVSVKTSESASKSDMSAHANLSKFNDYMKMVDVQNTARTQTPQGAAKSESVIAQIKFGMSAAAAKGEKQVTIQLYPKEMGTVDIHMKISASKGAEITMVAEKQETASMLQREAQSLKEALDDALKNQNTELNFAFREHENGQSKHQGGTFHMDANEFGLLEASEEMIPLQQVQLGLEQGVDLVI